MASRSIKKQHAFSLVEVLIALLILAIGMLAFAAAEIMGQRGTHSALKRSHATTLANDLAERMHANPSGNYIKSLSRNDCPIGNNIPVCSASIAANNNAIQNCTPDEMASYDLAMWFCGNNTSFRGGVVTLLGGPETDNDMSTGLAVAAEGGHHPPGRSPKASSTFLTGIRSQHSANRTSGQGIGDTKWCLISNIFG